MLKKHSFSQYPFLDGIYIEIPIFSFVSRGDPPHMVNMAGVVKTSPTLDKVLWLTTLS